MRRLVIAAGLVALGGAVFWTLTIPKTLAPNQTAELVGDATKGAQVFWAAGCASCHMAQGATGDATLVLSGGQRFASPLGTFLAPNISPDPDRGIGGWTLADFANAVTRGVSRKAHITTRPSPTAPTTKCSCKMWLTSKRIWTVCRHRPRQAAA